MKLIWMQAFLKIAETGSFSAAAEKLYISQSSLSKYINLFEKEYGIHLFTRNTRKVELTAEGKAILPHAEAMIKEYNKMEEKIVSMKKNMLETMEIVSVPVMHLEKFSNLLVSFQKKHRDLDINLLETGFQDVISHLNSGKNYIGIMRAPIALKTFNSNDWSIISILKDDLVCICSNNHPIAKIKKATLEQCLSYDLVLLTVGIPEYTVLFNYYNYPTTPLNNALRCSSTIPLEKYVESNLGISILSESAASAYSKNPNIKIVSLSDSPDFSICLVVQKKYENKYFRAFTDLMKEENFDVLPLNDHNHDTLHSI